MRISEIYELGATQFELDFVDIDVERDTRLFLDPYFLNIRQDSWSTSSSRTLRSFFDHFLLLVNQGQNNQARHLFDYLHEPNETCLGLSRGVPRGNAIGDIDADHLFESICQSNAVNTGLVEDLEDFRLFIRGIDKDKISDMTTNIIRKHLIEYTQNQCRLWGIPLTPNVQSGFYWDRVTRQWVSETTEMLVVGERRILLTPKSAVSFAKRYAPDQYYNKFVLTFLQHEHLRMQSPLVQYRADNITPYVTKKSLKESVAEFSKEYLTTFTQSHPEVFGEFKEWLVEEYEPISNEEITDIDQARVANYLIERLRGIPSGHSGATQYHRLMTGALEFLFYPDVTSPCVEREINDGRKRIDITYDNMASSGFFHRLHTVYNTPSQFIIVECKNYSRDIANPELDQLSGRFSTHRGRFGLALCRQVDDMNTLINRCNDIYVHQGHIIIPLTDNDVIEMLQLASQYEERPYEDILQNRFREIALQ